MPIRKTGSATGDVTGVEQPGAESLRTWQDLEEGKLPGRTAGRNWSPEDERELAAEDNDSPVQP
jgi:hypothetical protein